MRKNILLNVYISEFELPSLILFFQFYLFSFQFMISFFFTLERKFIGGGEERGGHRERHHIPGNGCMHGGRKAQKNTYQSLEFRNCLIEVEARSESREEANSKPHQRPGSVCEHRSHRKVRNVHVLETEATRRPCFKKGHMPSIE